MSRQELFQLHCDAKRNCVGRIERQVASYRKHLASVEITDQERGWLTRSLAQLSDDLAAANAAHPYEFCIEWEAA